MPGHVPGLEFLVGAAAGSQTSDSLGAPRCDTEHNVSHECESLWAWIPVCPCAGARKSRTVSKVLPPPTFLVPWKAAWQSACTHAGLNAAASARMRRNHKLPAQFRPVTHLVLPSGLPGVQNHGLKTGTGIGWVSKGNSPLNYTYLVVRLNGLNFIWSKDYFNVKLSK